MTLGFLEWEPPRPYLKNISSYLTKNEKNLLFCYRKDKTYRFFVKKYFISLTKKASYPEKKAKII